MHTGHIQNATRTLGAPLDWDRETDGYCGKLPIRDEVTSAGRTMISAWYPTPEERGRLQQGAPVYLYIVGSIHPPVAIEVGPPAGVVG